MDLCWRRPGTGGGEMGEDAQAGWKEDEEFRRNAGSLESLESIGAPFG
jgi:hypothetical protein